MSASVRDLGRRLLRLPARRKLELVWRIVRDERVPLGAKVIFPGLIGYLATPIDVIPDFIPVLGQLDDVVVAAGALWLFVRLCPSSVIEEHLKALTAG